MIFFELMSPICGDTPDAARWQPAPTQRHQGSHDCHFFGNHGANQVDVQQTDSILQHLIPRAFLRTALPYQQLSRPTSKKVIILKSRYLHKHRKKTSII